MMCHMVIGCCKMTYLHQNMIVWALIKEIEKHNNYVVWTMTLYP
jgi:hypothetical protein